MSTRCKPGGLAIIMYDVPQCTSNIGRLVEVSGPAEYDRNGRLTWLIQPVTPEPYLINTYHDDSVRVMGYPEAGIEHPDAWMLPVGAESADESVEQREDIPEEIEQQRDGLAHLTGRGDLFQLAAPAILAKQLNRRAT